MFKNDCGKLTIYASDTHAPKQRLESVKTATHKMAKKLNLNFEVVNQQRGTSPIYVYYDNGDENPIPIYCDEGKRGNPAEISEKMRNMMFVLSFHPRHTALKQARKMLLTLS